MLFPDRWSVTPEVVTELKKMVLHAISGGQQCFFCVSNFHERSADNVLSTTSVIPFDQEELTQILDLIDALKGWIICINSTLGNANGPIRWNQGIVSAC